MKKKVVAFAIADNNNLPYFKMMEKTLRHFHTEEELPLVLYGQKEMDAITDPSKYYKATPMFAKELLKEYDLVIKIDADYLFFHDLNHIINDDSYDVGTVLNWNRTDPLTYGEVAFATVFPQEYMNCGFVAMRSEEFVNRWWDLCNSYHFDRMPYKEQDILNVLYYWGGFKVKCLDHSDKWHGLIAKGEGLNMGVKDGKVVLLKNEDGYPTEDVVIVAYHYAGGQAAEKMNWRVTFSEEVQDFLGEILK